MSVYRGPAFDQLVRRSRVRFHASQSLALESAFAQTRYSNHVSRERIAHVLHLAEVQVRVSGLPERDTSTFEKWIFSEFVRNIRHLKGW